MKEIDKDIKKQFQSKFSDFKAPLPEDAWSAIETSLNTVVKTKKIHRIWAVSVAAVIAAIIGGGIMFMRHPVLQTQPEMTQSATPPTESVKEIKTEQPELAILSRKKKSEDNKKQVLSSKKGRRNIEVSERKTTYAAAHETVQPVVTEMPKKEAHATHSSKEDITEKEKEQLIREFAELGQKDYFVQEPEKNRKNKNGVLLALGGRGGLSSFQKTVNMPLSLRSATQNDEPKSDNGGVYTLSGVREASSTIGDNISEMQHAQPVSVGVTVSKEVINNLYIETGLNYTYLHSTVKNTNIGVENNETQEIHYLGVPLNVNYNLLSIHRLKVYASMGVMVEKDLYGTRKYRSKAVNEYSEEVNSEWEKKDIKQKNLQLSVNAGLGVSVPVYKNLNLYGKIGGAYYFDAKNEYKTIYSDRKVLMDLNVGLRVEF